MPMRELERLDKLGFRQLPCRAFDHDYVVFNAYINKIKIALSTLRMRRVRDELPVDPANAHRADWTAKRNIRNRQRGGRTVNRQNVGIILAVGAEQNRDNLRVVKISLRKERPQRPIDHARRERFLFRRTSLALKIATRKFP